MAQKLDNPLISTKPSDSGLHVALHPLVLLTISDYATRHSARQQQGPIVGALLGQQQGRQITLEHAFECHTKRDSNDEIVLDAAWFETRVQQCKLPSPSGNFYSTSSRERIFLTSCRAKPHSPRRTQRTPARSRRMVYSHT